MGDGGGDQVLGAGAGVSVDGLLALDADALAGDEAVRVLREAHRAISRLEALRLRALGAVERSEAWRVGGAVSVTAWLRHQLGVDHRVARCEVRLARAMSLMPAVAASLAAGDMGRAHAEVVARIGLANQARADALPAVEAVFAQVGCSRPPSVLARVARAWADQVDPMATLADEQQAHERRFAHLSQVGDGWRLDGFFGHEQGAILAGALNAAIILARRRGRDQDGYQCEGQGRDAGQHGAGLWGGGAAASPGSRDRADALVDLARLALASGGLPESGGAKPTVVVTVPLSRLEAATGQQAGGQLPFVGGPGGGWAAAGGQLPFVGGSAEVAVANGIGEAIVSATTAQRISCDAEVQRIVLDPEGLPLDVGRATRVVPPQLRRALNARDRGCVFPGCDRPPGWTEAHHLTHWARGGSTSLANTALLCARHHHDVHACGHEITIGPNGRPEITLNPRRAQAQPRAA